MDVQLAVVSPCPSGISLARFLAQLLSFLILNSGSHILHVHFTRLHVQSAIVSHEA